MKVPSLILFLCSCYFLSAQVQKKENDHDVIYREDKVPYYDLPKLLVSAEGQDITTTKQWMEVRRPQLVGLFSNLVYGTVPRSVDEVVVDYTNGDIDAEFLDGKATRKIIEIGFSNKRGSAKMRLLIIQPNHLSSPMPAFVMLNFDDPDSEKMQLDSVNKGMLNNGIPIEQIIDQGYAFVSLYHQDLIGHNEVEFRNSIQQLFFIQGQSFPKANEWGVLATISWSARQALDYLETDPNIDATKVALLGHSKLGKCTLWAAAQDPRFALAISIQSGCGGAALWRRKFGETLAKMSVFPHWLCGNARKFINQEDDLPVDQHMLLALIAPRPIYIASAQDDDWADPRGEYLSAYHASEVYRLFGKKGLETSTMPNLEQPLIKQQVGYHIRPGGHHISLYDWQQFIAFANYHFSK